MRSRFAFNSRLRRATIFDLLWLFALGVYILAGINIATFHGDEAMHIYGSRDYAVAFIYRAPDELTAGPPYLIDSDPFLRILNGSLIRYSIGLSWHVAGLNDGDLPPRPGWDWGLDYATNVETGHRPSDKLLTSARLSSALFLALSVAVMFAIGWQFGGRLPAYLASGLYALNPIVLLNGRRAMQEGLMLFFGLLTVLIAIHISKRREQEAAISWRWWLALILSSALALASKHSAGIFVASGFGWILLADLTRDRRRVAKSIARLALSTVLVLALFVAFSPALWRNPLDRFQDLLTVRRDLIDIQANADPDAPISLGERIEGFVMQPFIEKPAHFEVASWGEAQPIVDEIERFDASPLSGARFGVWLGLPLTLLAGGGLALLLWARLRVSKTHTSGLLLWLGITAASLLVNPLPWQRYYLPLIPIVTLLAGFALATLLGYFLPKGQHSELPNEAA